MNWIKPLLLTVIGVVALWGCSSERHVRDIAYDVSVDENPGQQIMELEKQIAAAREKRVYLLSPSWFESAEMSLNDAKSIRDSNGDVQDIFREVAEGRAQLSRAEAFAEVSRKQLADVIKARDAALVARNSAKGAGAARLSDLQSAFNDADKEFTDMTRDVEDGKLESINDERSEMIQRYALVETMALKKEKLDTARRVLDQAIREGAKSYAPRTLASAEQTLKTAESFINSNPSQSAQVDQKSDEAVFFAHRALQMTRESRQFSEKKPEELALWVEDTLVSVGNEMGNTRDLRDRRFDEQISSLKGHAQGLRTGNQTAGGMPDPTEERM